MQHPTKSTHGEEAASELRRRALAAGERIAGVISTSSSVYYPGRIRVVSLYLCKLIILHLSFSGSEEYTRKITHTFGWATQESACVVEPGTVEDLSKTVCIHLYHYLHSLIEPFLDENNLRDTNPLRCKFFFSLASLLLCSPRGLPMLFNSEYAALTV